MDKKKVIIITPSYRVKNLPKILKSIRFNEIQGNAQRNKGLDYIYKNFVDENLFVYFLDDDNIIHPDFYELISNIKINIFYTFDQQRNRYVFSGEKPKVSYIDLAMFLFDFKLVKDIRFVLDKYEADGMYVEECCNSDIKKHVYLPKIYCYYNYLGRNIIRRSYYRFIWYFRHLISKHLKIFKITKQKKP